MLDQIKQHLQSVRLRQRYHLGLRAATMGLLVSTALGCGLIIAQKFGVSVETSLIWGQLVVVTLLSGMAGLLFPQHWSSTARLVDTAYRLKDRTSTALEFAGKGLHDEVYQLQQEDALAHLTDIKPEQVVPWKMPRLGPACIAIFCVMLGLSFIPQRNVAIAAAPVPLEAVQNVTVLLEQTMLEELKKLQETQDHQELEELTKELQELVEEMKAADVDQKEALAKLSEMQQLLNNAIENLDVAAMEAQLTELAAALEPAEAMQAASQAMKNGEYGQASAELEKIDPQNMSRREREAVQSNLAKLSKKLGNGKKGELSNAISEMAEGLENENSSQCKSGLCKAAGVCKSQGLKKSIRECLNCQLNRLAECKGNCQGNCQMPGSNKVAKSESPSNQWGTGASGQPAGDKKTSLDSTRREENVTGIMGEGTSEKETETTLEARQSASRSYQERYQEFKKQMEEVLDSEPLPLGHRATVRRYFEAIRPDTNQAEQVDANPAP